MKNFLLPFLIFLLLSLHAVAQPGSLDSSFNGNGKVITQLIGNHNNHFTGHATGVAIQNDGKIMTCGAALGGLGDKFVGVRYKTDGELDSTLGINGQIYTQFEGREMAESVDCNAIALQTDGQIILAGSAPSYYDDFTLVRYTQTGTLNLNVSTGFDFFGSHSSHSRAVAIQPDGKIVQAGYDNDNDNIFSFALIRFLPDGTRDGSFGGDGIVTTTLTAGNVNYGNSLALQPDGKIILAGTTMQRTDGNIVLIRYLSDGRPDSTFATNGIAITDLNGNDEGNALVLQASGKIVVAGTTNTGGTSDFFMVRYTAGGIIDSGFGINGVVISSLGGEDFATAAALQPDGKIIVAGTSNGTGTADFAVMRYSMEGVTDSSFGTNGKALADFGGTVTGYGVAIQPDGAIVEVGDYGDKFALARFKGDNTGVLAVNMADFKICRQGSSVKLSWASVNELNIAGYEVERSADSKQFKSIGAVRALQNGRAVTEYSFVDAHPLNGSNFYYIKAMDRDGKETHTGIARIDFENNTYIAYPNPAKDVVRIGGLQAATTKTISLINVTGKIVQQTVTRDAGYTFNIKQLPAGTYYIRITTNNGVTTLKFIK